MNILVYNNVKFTYKKLIVIVFILITNIKTILFINLLPIFDITIIIIKHLFTI